jgi:hypothetical protein
VIKTVCFVYLLPTIALGFLSGVLFMLTAFTLLTGGAAAYWPSLILTVVWSTLNLAKDAAFIYWSRSRLLANFRAVAARDGSARTQFAVGA